MTEAERTCCRRDKGPQPGACAARRSGDASRCDELPAKRDVEVSDADLKKYNLVLVGDKSTNALIGRIADRLPLVAAADHVSLAGKTWKGSRIGHQFIAFNPLNPKRYVVVTGMNDWAVRDAWKLHPSRYGLCDYFVYDLSSPTPLLIDAGYFGAEVWK